MAQKPKANPTMDSSILKLNVIVVGAGIGGMAAATALGRRGHNVTVFEDAPQIGEVLPWVSALNVGWRRYPSVSKFVTNSEQLGPGSCLGSQRCPTSSNCCQTLARWKRIGRGTSYAQN